MLCGPLSLEIGPRRGVKYHRLIANCIVSQSVIQSGMHTMCIFNFMHVGTQTDGQSDGYHTHLAQAMTFVCSSEPARKSNTGSSDTCMVAEPRSM